jgi:hypothetical protein
MPVHFIPRAGFLSIPLVSFAYTALGSEWYQVKDSTTSRSRTYFLYKAIDCDAGGECAEVPDSKSIPALCIYAALDLMASAQLALALKYVRIRLKRLADARGFLSRGEVCPSTLPVLAAVASMSLFLSVVGFVVAESHFTYAIPAFSNDKYTSESARLCAFLNVFVAILSALLSWGLALWLRGAPLVGTCCGEAYPAPPSTSPAATDPAIVTYPHNFS